MWTYQKKQTFLQHVNSNPSPTQVQADASYPVHVVDMLQQNVDGFHTCILKLDIMQRRRNTVPYSYPLLERLYLIVV
jgi:hypothetical protein